MGKAELLSDVIAHARASGIGQASLRELADTIGSSHRMLLYHFGSREGLLAAIVAENEAGERAVAESYVRERVPWSAALRNTWRRVRQPSRAGEVKLFFELAAMAMYQRPGTERVADVMVSEWVALAEAHDVDPALIRLDIAVMRGLLLDMLVTGDRAGTDSAFERYRQLRVEFPTGPR